MTMQELEITIDNEGRVLIHVNGVKGEECLTLTKKLEDEVGDVQERAFSPDYYEQPVEISHYRNNRLR
jgi:hypothetical protein